MVWRITNSVVPAVVGILCSHSVLRADPLDIPNQPLLRPVASAATLIQPSDLRYLGAFRLPDSPATPDNVGWEWSNWAGAIDRS